MSWTASSLSRRRFLVVLIAFAAAGLSPRRATALLMARTAEGTTASTSSATSPAVGGLDGVDAVGTVYLSRFPAEASVASLRDSLGLGTSRDASRGTRRLARRIEADFEASDVVAIDGWRLSRTEARWAALTHLERGE